MLRKHKFAAVAAALVLAGCSAQAQDYSASVSQAPAPAEAPANLIINDNGSVDPANERSVTFATINGADAFNKAVTDFVKQEWEARPAEDANLNVKWQTLPTINPVFGELVTASWMKDGNVLGSKQRSFFATNNGKGALTDADILTPEGARIVQAKAAQVLAPAAAGTAKDTAQKLAEQVGGPDGGNIKIATVNITTPTQLAALVSAGDSLQWVELSGDITKLLTDRGQVLVNGGGQQAFAAPAPAAARVAQSVVPQKATPPVDCEKEKCLALTFDDGPGPFTAELLDVLDAEDVKATFFVIGKNAAAHEDLVSRELAAGHAVGSHTWNHFELNRLSDAKVREEVQSTADLITRLDGGNVSPIMRPPYGSADDRVQAILKDMGLAPILWDIDTVDWKYKDTARAIRVATENAKPGGIILMHDIHESTVKAVPQMIKNLKQAGYHLVTVPQLFGDKYQPGVRHCGQHSIGAPTCRTW